MEDVLSRYRRQSTFIYLSIEFSGGQGAAVFHIDGSFQMIIVVLLVRDLVDGSTSGRYLVLLGR